MKAVLFSGTAEIGRRTFSASGWSSVSRSNETSRGMQSEATIWRCIPRFSERFVRRRTVLSFSWPLAWLSSGAMREMTFVFSSSTTTSWKMDRFLRKVTTIRSE